MKMGWKDEARARAKEKSEGERFKVAVGENCLRILPNKKDPEAEPYIEFNSHRNVGPDKAWLRCGKDVKSRGKCWLCDVKIPELRESASASKRAQANILRAEEQMVVQVSRVVDGRFSSPKGWLISSRNLHVAILKKLGDLKYSYDDPVKGYNLNLERTGTGKTDTRYGALEKDDAPTKVPRAVLEASKPLDDLIPSYSAEEQKSAFYGRPKEEEQDEPEPEPEEETEESETEESEEEEEETEESESESESEEEEAESEEEEEESEPDEEEEEEEEPEPPKKKAPAPAKKKLGKPVTKKR
jgi:hypothetical protein